MAFWSVFIVSLALHWFIRILSLVWNWSTFTNQSCLAIAHALVAGLRFDFFSVTWLAMPPMLVALLLSFVVKNSSRWMIFLVGSVQLIGLWLNLADAEMVRVAGRRFEFWDKFFLEESTSVFAGLGLQYWPLFVFGALIWFALFYFSIQLAKHLPVVTGWKRRGAMAFLSLAVLVVGARGGFQPKPVDYAHANLFQSVALNTLTMNSVFTIIRSAKKVRIPKNDFMPPHEILPYIEGRKLTPSALEGRRPRKPQNIVILMLESLSFEHMGRPFNEPGFTPFLDELAQRSLFFSKGIANAKRSIDGVCAVLAGIPAWSDEPFISSPAMNTDFGGMANFLKPLGYSSAFFHGGNNGTMYFDSFAPRAGFDNYYGANEYPDQRQNDGAWGIYDEPFMQFAALKMGEMKPPFLAALFTLSSHNPYLVPKEHKGRFPKGTLAIHESIGYTDFALRKFFETAEKQKWYENTLFVITADHAFYEVRHPSFNNEVGWSRIPILFFHPQAPLPKVNEDQVVQQIDILPSILDYLGILDREHILMGKSVFTSGVRSALFASGGMDYWFLRGDHFLHYRRGSSHVLFALPDQEERRPLLDQPELVKDLATRVEAQLQYYSQSLLGSKLLEKPVVEASSVRR